jgi:FtsH-binding integral membrane protein
MPDGASEMANLENPPNAKLPASDGSTALRVIATILRAAFILTLLVLTVRVSMPQNETIWTAYDTPADLIRFLLGLAVCLWLGVQLFQGPSDASGYRTWLYLGLVAVPFALICLFAVW